MVLNDFVTLTNGFNNYCHSPKCVTAEMMTNFPFSNDSPVKRGFSQFGNPKVALHSGIYLHYKALVKYLLLIIIIIIINEAIRN